MYRFVIEGGTPLKGTIEVLGSKNAALPLIAASLLTNKTVKLRNIPTILDVERMLEIIQSLGGEVERKGTTLFLNNEQVKGSTASSQVMGKLRGSILLLGSLLGRHRYVRLPHPGGDIIGARPIDTHLDAFRQLGAKIKREDEIIEIDGRNMKAGPVVLREFSVTATENVMMVAATLPGETTIHTAAAEPHISALAILLNRMGARVSETASHTITVRGRRNLKGGAFTNISDMLEAGFFILLGAATRSKIKVEGAPIADLRLFFKKLDDIGIKYRTDDRTASVTVLPSTLRSFKMQSLPHPGIPTDMQAPFSVIATQAQGSSLIHDPLYEGRLRHILELTKMGASAVICDPHRVIINGPTPLFGKTMPSLDIRSGATLVMAGLVAEGRTIIEEADIIERGYFQLPERLQSLGARINKVQET